MHYKPPVDQAVVAIYVPGLFDPGTEYVRLVITVDHLRLELFGSTLLKLAQTRSLCTFKPLEQR